MRVVAATKFCCIDKDFHKNFPVHTKPCVASLRSKHFRLVLEKRKTEERDFRFWPREKWNDSQSSHGLWLSFRNRTETLARQAMWRRNVLLQLVPPRPGACEEMWKSVTSATFVPRLKFMIIVRSLHLTLSLKLHSDVFLEDRGYRLLSNNGLFLNTTDYKVIEFLIAEISRFRLLLKGTFNKASRGTPAILKSLHS